MIKNNKLKNLDDQFATKKDVEAMGTGLGMLIEKVHDDVKLIAEQYGGVQKRLGSIEHTLESHTEMIGRIAVELNVVKVDLNMVKDDVGIMKEDIAIIKHDLKRKVDYDEFASLERRVAHLEKKG
ncbi:MAG: hypothetical protein Q8L47_04570 [bacterium]|nr:hypothetical protein [bacterium]